MGQYFHAYIEKGKDYHVFSCPGTLKLMEHSWLKNDMVGAVMAEILDNPSKVAWIGDYANDPTDSFGLSRKKFAEVYDRAWGKDDSHTTTMHLWEYKPTETEAQLVEDLSHAFIVNKSKKCFISLDAYKKACTEAILEMNPEADTNWIVHPLPLYTACGNGRGSGDYPKSDISSYAVGSWAFDTIYATYDASQIPVTYTDESLDTLFIEKSLI
jgi:hypothetical protein